MLPEIPVENIILALGYAGIFFLMITNGFTTFPSSQVLYIIAGYFISVGNLAFLPVIAVGAIGNTIGNIFLYEAVRAKGLEFITRFKLFPKREILKLEIAFRQRGAGFLFLGKLIPALKVFVPAAAGIARTPRILFAVLMLVSSAIWAVPFLMIGYYFGKSSDVFGKYSLVLILVALVVLAALYKLMNSKKVLHEVNQVQDPKENISLDQKL